MPLQTDETLQMAGGILRQLITSTALYTISSWVFVLASLPAVAESQFNWNPSLTGAQDWSVDGNWDQPGFPNGTTHVANLSAPLTSSLNVSLGNNTYTLAGLSLGGTTSAVATDVNAGQNGLLVFQNDDAAFNGGIPLITSLGVAGSTNTISANTQLNEQLDFGSASTNNVIVNGVVTAVGTAPSIRSFMPAGLSAKINYLSLTDPANGSNYRRFRLNDSAGSPAGMPAVSTQGTLELGEITGYGELSIGVTASQHPLPLGTVILRGENSLTGYIQINRANVVLGRDGSLGSYGIFGGQPNQGVGFNLFSSDDGRVEYARVDISQWVSIKGEHSLTWRNIAVQSNSRGWINLLPAGKTFTLEYGQYAVSGNDTERIFTFDGTGRTIVSGGLHDKYIFNQGPASDGIGSFRKTGTGSVFVSGAISTYHGTTIVEAGTLRFASNIDLALTGSIVSTGGALGVDSGIFSNPGLVAKLDAADTGGIMLSATEAAANLDFTSGPLAVAPNISVAAPENGISYTGTITPAGSNYRLGGGSGTLTLPNTNQLTGGRGLVVTNGGEVRVTSTNDYTGPTVVSDYSFASRTNQAIADTTAGISQQMFAPTTLTVSSLKSGGVDSSIGLSSDDPGNLVIRGSRLRIDGETDDIQRLFTVGVRGATIETIGATIAHFVNGGAIAMEPGGAATTRSLTLSAESSINGMSPLIQDASDGGRVGVIKNGAGTWELYGENTYTGPTQIQQGQLNVNGAQTGTGETIVGADGTLGGTGTVGGSVTVHGAIAPGRRVGTLHVAGALTLDETSEMEIEILSVTPGHFDRLEVAGTAQLAGTLRVKLPDQVGGSYAPKLGDVFPFLAVSGGAGGMFDAFDLPTLTSGLAWELNPGNVTVFLTVVAALPGDYNLNGVVDAGDYTVWRDSLGQEGIGLAADGDRNDVVDELDYTVWKSHFGMSLGSGSGALQGAESVPESSGVVIMGLLVVGLVALSDQVAFRRPFARRGG